MSTSENDGNRRAGIVVQKYGGSSVADPEKIRAVAARIMRTRDAGYDVCVVVSAMGDTTDDLLTRAKQLSANPARRELDMLLSAGERISMALLSIAIRELGGDAISFTGSQSGIITNDRHSDARIIEVRPFRVQDELSRGKIVVVAGYQGVSYKKEVTTLGRGGSDTTAVAMAAALGARWCEICSDVDGVYSADPRVASTAHRIGELSYEEMQEMAEAGARVLNAQAVEFAKEKNIAIYARATAQEPPISPTDAIDGTVVRKFAPRRPGNVTAVVSESAVMMVRAEGRLGMVERVLERLEGCHAVGKQLQVDRPGKSDGNQPEERLSLVLSRENLHEEPAFRRAVMEYNHANASADHISIHDGFGAVSIIGAGINASYRNVLTGTSRLHAAGIFAGDMATSSFRVTWLVPSEQLDESVRVLHHHYLETPLPPVP